MIVTGFQSLLDAARQQPEPQRLLLVFARAELPDGATAAERARFEAEPARTAVCPPVAAC